MLLGSVQLHLFSLQSRSSRLSKSNKVRAMLLPGTRSLASSLPWLLLKTDIQTRRKERESAAGAPGPPRLQPGAAAWGQRPSPVRIYTSSHTRSGIRKPTPDLWQFFLKIRRWEGENDQRWRCPKAAALKWRVEGVAPTPPRGAPGPPRGAAFLPVFSLISHRTLKSAGFIL